MNRHIKASRLALYAGGDLGWVERLPVVLHLRRCERCRAEVEAFRRSAAELRNGALELPEGLDWPSLAAEMKANIRLGLEAGQLVEPVRRDARSRPLSWRAALVLGAATTVVIMGWFLNLPKPQPQFAAAEGVVLEVTQDGVELKEGGSAITLMNPGSSENLLTTVSAQGSVRARYVDAETGQVTVTNVYAE